MTVLLRRVGHALPWSLLGALLFGLGLRVWFNARSDWMIDGDEALFGLAAWRILHGAHPVFLYGVPYMGMLQSYAAAPFVALLGPRPVALRLVTLLGSGAVIVATWRLALAWYGPAEAALAAWIAALPSVYFDATGLKVWGVYLGVMALGSVLLLGAWRCREREGRLSRRWWAGMGAATGLALWANFLVVYYLATALLLLPWRRLGRWLPSALLCGLPAAAVAGMPLWWYNLARQGATFRFVFGGAVAADPQFGAVVHVLFDTLLPRLLGVSGAWGTAPRPLRAALAVLLAAALLLTLFDVAAGLRGGRAPRRQAPVWRKMVRWWAGDQGDTGGAPSAATVPSKVRVPHRVVRRTRHAWPPLLFLAVCLGIYLVSGFGRPSLSPFDASGRYLLPLWTAIPLLLASLCARLGRLWLPAGALALLLVGGADLAGHLASDPRLVFQSPYWDHLPEDNRPLLRALEAAGINAVWMNHWAGNQVLFMSGEAVLSADYYDIVVGHGINRLPAVFEAVRAAPRAAFVVVAPGDPHPPIAAALDRLGVRYTHLSLPPYQVYLPTSRRVDPAEVAEALRYPY